MLFDMLLNRYTTLVNKTGVKGNKAAELRWQYTLVFDRKRHEVSNELYTQFKAQPIIESNHVHEYCIITSKHYMAINVLCKLFTGDPL